MREHRDAENADCRKSDRHGFNLYVGPLLGNQVSIILDMWKSRGCEYFTYRFSGEVISKFITNKNKVLNLDNNKANYSPQIQKKQ